MYKNIIFDLGGVVVDFKPRDFLMDHFLNKRAEDEVFDLTFGSKEWEELDRGVISRGTANRLMLENAAERGRTFEVQAAVSYTHLWRPCRCGCADRTALHGEPYRGEQPQRSRRTGC